MVSRKTKDTISVVGMMMAVLVLILFILAICFGDEEAAKYTSKNRSTLRRQRDIADDATPSASLLDRVLGYATIVSTVLNSWEEGHQINTDVEEQDRPYWHGDATTAYDNGDLTIKAPTIENPDDDLLFLFLHRTDAPLPLEVPGWKRVAGCLKSKDNQSRCYTAEDCRSESSKGYCKRMPSGSGEDLGTIVFYKEATNVESDAEWEIDMSGSHPSWAIVTTVYGVDKTNPVRSIAMESCDNSNDSKFPSIQGGRAGDILLLSMAFDDRARRSDFRPPDGTELIGFENGADETGILYGTVLTEDGPTGMKKTRGSGGRDCLDALISMTLRKSDELT